MIFIERRKWAVIDTVFLEKTQRFHIQTDHILKEEIRKYSHLFNIFTKFQRKMDKRKEFYMSH